MVKRILLFAVFCFVSTSVFTQSQVNNPSKIIAIFADQMDFEEYAQSKLYQMNKHITRNSPAAELSKNQKTKLLIVLRQLAAELFDKDRTRMEFAQWGEEVEEKYKPRIHRILSVVQRRALHASNAVAR